MILEIGDILKSVNYKLNIPATDTEVQRLREHVKEKFNVDLPREYEEFLKTVNGLDFDGLVLYGVDGMKMNFKKSIFSLAIQILRGFVRAYQTVLI